MRVDRRAFVLGAASLAACPEWCFGEPSAGSSGVPPWERPDGRASDRTLLRRLTLDLAGRLPTPGEQRAFVREPEGGRLERLVDRLLASDDFADYWSMRLADLLRVKSEFPINLWPNAVYVYHRRIREAVRNDEPLDAFARALVTGAGSSFRDAEANFVRASADRSPAGLARLAVRTFFDEDIDCWPASERAAAVRAFSSVRIKSTREWKEELVCSDGPDGRAAFADLIVGSHRPRFAAAFTGFVNYWLFGKRGATNDRVAAFLRGGCRLKPLCRAIALSDAYRRGSVTGGFPLRRLDAEVLEDILRQVTRTERDYQSIAPEPFTILPEGRKSVLIEDGSISSSFLALFGRPARDSGLLEERDNAVTAKQRLALLNSARLYGHFGRIRGDIEALYELLLARRPTDREKSLAAKSRLPTRDLAWCLVNTREFIYRV